MRHRLTQTVATVKEYIFTEEELQDIVDVYFSCIMATVTQAVELGITEKDFYKESEPNAGDSVRDKYMRNAAYHLREAGIDTHPMGMSWGAIVDEKFRERVPVESRIK
jgi:hypothetical protein